MCVDCHVCLLYCIPHHAAMYPVNNSQDFLISFIYWSQNTSSCMSLFCTLTYYNIYVKKKEDDTQHDSTYADGNLPAIRVQM